MSVATPLRSERAAALARQIALAAAWGLDAPPSVPVVAPASCVAADAFLALPAAQDLRYNLEPFADLLGHESKSPRGIVGLPLRLFRRFCKWIMAPWLDLQTLHNRALLETLRHEQEHGRGYLTQLAEHVRNQQSALHDLQQHLARQHGEMDRMQQMQRLSLRHVVAALEQAAPVAPPELSQGNALLEQAFFQTWLPRPPARLRAYHAESLGLAGLGYEVLADNDSAEVIFDKCDERAAVDAVIGRFHEGTPRAFWSACEARLRPGCRLLIAIAAQEMPPLSAGFTLLEGALARPGEQSWRYAQDRREWLTLLSDDVSRSVAYLALERR